MRVLAGAFVTLGRGRCSFETWRSFLSLAVDGGMRRRGAIVSVMAQIKEPKEQREKDTGE
jgi:hypothetical protein